jgi:hypothetical protein
MNNNFLSPELKNLKKIGQKYETLLQRYLDYLELTQNQHNIQPAHLFWLGRQVHRLLVLVTDLTRWFNQEERYVRSFDFDAMVDDIINDDENLH